MFQINHILTQESDFISKRSVSIYALTDLDPKVFGLIQEPQQLLNRLLLEKQGTYPPKVEE